MNSLYFYFTHAGLIIGSSIGGIIIFIGIAASIIIAVTIYCKKHNPHHNDEEAHRCLVPSAGTDYNAVDNVDPPQAQQEIMNDNAAAMDPPQAQEQPMDNAGHAAVDIDQPDSLVVHEYHPKDDDPVQNDQCN